MWVFTELIDERLTLRPNQETLGQTTLHDKVQGLAASQWILSGYCTIFWHIVPTAQTSSAILCSTGKVLVVCAGAYTPVQCDAIVIVAEQCKMRTSSWSTFEYRESSGE